MMTVRDVYEKIVTSPYVMEFVDTETGKTMKLTNQFTVYDDFVYLFAKEDGYKDYPQAKCGDIIKGFEDEGRREYYIPNSIFEMNYFLDCEVLVAIAGENGIDSDSFIYYDLQSIEIGDYSKRVFLKGTISPECTEDIVRKTLSTKSKDYTAEKMCELLMDTDTHTYNMYEDLADYYIKGNESTRKTIDFTCSVLLGKDFKDIAKEMIFDEETGD